MTWLKVETITPDKTEMTQILRLCKCSRADAFLAFFRFFVWADSCTADGVLKGATLADCDEQAQLAGFGNAGVTVGWLECTNDGVRILNFERHNGQSTKHRLSNAARQARFKSRSIRHKQARH